MSALVGSSSAYLLENTHSVWWAFSCIIKEPIFEKGSHCFALSVWLYSTAVKSTGCSKTSASLRKIDTVYLWPCGHQPKLIPEEGRAQFASVYTNGSYWHLCIIWCVWHHAVSYTNGTSYFLPSQICFKYEFMKSTVEYLKMSHNRLYA